MPKIYFLDNCRKEMGNKYLRKVEKIEEVEEILLIYEKNGKIYEYNGEKDVIFSNDSKLCLYTGQLDENKAPHGYGKLTFCDKSITGNFYHGMPMDSSAVLETNKYNAIAIILGYEIIDYEYIQYKKN